MGHHFGLLTLLLILGPSLPVTAQPTAPAATTETPEQVILRKLQTPMTVEFEKTPLKDALATIAEKAGVPLVLHLTPDEDAQFDPSELVTDRFRNSSAATVLELLLRPLCLTWTVRDEVLQVTWDTRDVEEIGIQQTYNISRIRNQEQTAIPPGKLEQPWGASPVEGAFCLRSPLKAHEWLIDVVQHHTGGPPAGPWLDMDGGGGTLDIVGNTLIVRQTMQVQLQIQALLTAVENAYAQKPGFQPIYVARRPGYPLGVDQQIREALKKPANFNFQATPLNEVLSVVEQQIGFPVRLDRKALEEDEKISLQQPVDVQLAGISLDAALRLMLRRLGLVYLVDEGMLTVTTTTGAADLSCYGQLMLYDLRQLPFEMRPELLEALMSTTGGPPHGPWLDVDGNGGVYTLLPGGLVVVRQTAAAHTEIGRLIHNFHQTHQASERSAEPVTAPVPEPEPTDWVLRYYRFYDTYYCGQVEKVLPIMVAPETWGNNAGAIIFNFDTTLVIRQTPEVHRKIVERLAEMNKELFSTDPWWFAPLAPPAQ